MYAQSRIPGTAIRFGKGLAVDLTSGELFRQGRRVRLQEQPFQILAALLEHPGEVVTREELRHRLWPDDTVANCDEGLNSAVRRLRFTLRDSAEQPRYIETIPRRGYRFIATVEGDGDSPGAPSPAFSPIAEVPEEASETLSVTSNTETRSRRNAHLVFPALVVATAASLGVLWWGNFPGQASPPSLSFEQLTRSVGPERNPTISPDGNFIAFVSRNGDNDDIFLQGIRGNAAVNLTESSTHDDSQPAFSPNARFIAFRSERLGGGVFSMDLTGQSLQRLSDFGYDPDWSPDAEDVVVATEGVIDPLSRTSKSSLWRINVRTGYKRRITEGDAVQPAWSPNGHRIAFWSITDGGNRAIRSIPADGGEAVTIVDDSSVNWGPAWTADGEYLYFASDRGGSMNLWRVRIHERSGRPLREPEPMMTPSLWSGEPAIDAGGTRLVFTAAQRRSNVERVALDPESLTLKGAPVPVTEQSVPVTHPQVSPDGEWIVFRTESVQEDLYLSRTDGSDIRRLTFDAAKDRGPSWSPDGQRIAFYSDRNGKYDIWTIRPDGAGLERLTDIREDWISYPVWSPDGTRLVVNNSRGSYLITPPDSGPTQPLAPLPLYPDRNLVFRAVSWSPDGRLLAGLRYRLNGTRAPGIVTFSFETGTYKVVAEVGNWASWLSDSVHLVVGEASSLYLVNCVTRKARELLSVTGRIPPGFSVSRDDTAIYFSHAATESDIWLAVIE